MLFRDLGPLQVEIDDLEVPLPGRRPTAVLARLVASANEAVSGDALVEATWGDQVPVRAHQALDTVVWRLRSVLEPGRASRAASMIRKQDGGYRLAVPTSNVDSYRFIDLAEQALRALTAEDPVEALRLCDVALPLWRGEPYGSLADAAWVLPIRQRLAERRLDLSTYRIQALLDTNQPELALNAVLPLLADHPFHERFWALRILGLYRTGRQADALAAYDSARRVLADELGVDPGPDLRSLHDQVLRQAPELDRAAPSTVTPVFEGPVRLPSRRGSLIGREESVAAIVARLGSDRLVTVTGPGGAGKTRTAVEAAYRLRHDYPAGVWFVDLAELRSEDADPARLRDIIASTLELAPRSDLPVARVLIEQLRQRRLLLVIDNCEQVLDAVAEIIDEILDAAPSVSVLATSREALDLAGEAVVQLSPLAADDAAALFVERLASVRPDLDPVGADRGDIAAICESVGGLPLGIELAAARARVFELNEVASSLTDGVTELDRRGGRGPRRQASMGDTIDWSYRLASPAEQILHRRLAALPGPLTIEAARVLCSVAPLHPDQAPALVAGLVHRSLLLSSRPHGRDGVTAFRQLVPTRAHAAHLLGPDELAPVRQSLDDWVVRSVGAAALDGSGGQAAASAWVRVNTTAISATLTSTLVDAPRPQALMLLARLTLYWFERNQLLGAAHWYRAAATAAADGTFDGPDAAVARLLALCSGALAQDDAAAARMADELPHLTDPPPAVAPLAAEALVLAAASTWVCQRPDVGGPACRAALALGERLGLAQVVLRARALYDIHRLATPERRPALLDARQILAAPSENRFADFVAAYACSLGALEDGDPHSAQRWMARAVEAHRSLAMQPTSELLEDVARILAHAGEQASAVRCYAAAAARHVHDGLPWPRLPHSPAVLAELEAAVPAADHERLWRSGERLGLSIDPAVLLDEWFPDTGTLETRVSGFGVSESRAGDPWSEGSRAMPARRA